MDQQPKHKTFRYLAYRRVLEGLEVPCVCIQLAFDGNRAVSDHSCRWIAQKCCEIESSFQLSTGLDRAGQSAILVEEVSLVNDVQDGVVAVYGLHVFRQEQRVQHIDSNLGCQALRWEFVGFNDVNCLDQLEA